MAPATHILMSWTVSAKLFKNRRERVFISICGFAPDLDGLGIIIDWITQETTYYIDYHRYLGHNLYFAILMSCLGFYIMKEEKVKIGITSFLMVHLHIFCDIIGSKGGDGFIWPVYYLYPIDPNFAFVWQGQWFLNGWQNYTITFILLLICLFIGIKKKITVFEILSESLNQRTITMMQRVFKT